MEPEKTRVGKYTSRNPSYLYTHIKRVGVVLLIDDQHDHVVFISIYTPMAATQRCFLKKVVEHFFVCFFLLHNISIPLSLANTDMAFKDFFLGGGRGGGGWRAKQTYISIESKGQNTFQQ